MYFLVFSLAGYFDLLSMLGFVFQQYPDYYAIIKEPIDLKTIAQRIQVWKWPYVEICSLGQIGPQSFFRPFKENRSRCYCKELLLIAIYYCKQIRGVTEYSFGGISIASLLHFFCRKESKIFIDCFIVLVSFAFRTEIKAHWSWTFLIVKGILSMRGLLFIFIGFQIVLGYFRVKVTYNKH